jgi:hypothetical protein
VGPDVDPSWQSVQAPACSDGLDNDGDGQIDYPNDTGCASASDNVEENACNDDVDNDGDGHIDFPGDPGCTSPSDTDEFNPVTACNDGIDNDGDDQIDYPDDPGCDSATDNSEAAPPSGAFVRPKHAGTLTLPLVPAFNACTSPNRQHGPPLAFPSCNPPVHSSNAVTIGTTEANGANENSIARVKLMAQIGAPGPPDNADIVIALTVTDVRCKAGTTTCGNANDVDGPDYTGQLQGNATVRITDRWNAVAAGGGSEGATLVDIPFPMPTGCANTDTGVGATCANTTSFNAIVPMAIRERKRSNIEVAQVLLNDGGSDGNTSTAPNTTFMKQGVFVP